MERTLSIVVSADGTIQHDLPATRETLKASVFVVRTRGDNGRLYIVKDTYARSDRGWMPGPRGGWSTDAVTAQREAERRSAQCVRTNAASK